MDGYGGAAWYAGAPKEEETVLFRVVVPKQNLRGEAERTAAGRSPEDGYLASVRPYGVLGMAWAIWREVPDVPPRAAFSLAREVCRKKEAEVLLSTRFLAEHIQGRLWARHHLLSRLERFS